MTSKTIKISEENYRWLLHIAAELQKKRGKVITFDETLDELKEKRKGNKSIMKLAGSWDMSDEEWKKINNELRRGWKKWKVPSV